MLLPLSFLLFLFTAAIPTFAHPVGAGLDHLNQGAVGAVGQNASLFQNVTQICGTRGPSHELRRAHADFLDQSRRGKKERRASSPIVVQTYIHFVSTTDQMNNYPSSVRTAMVTSQVLLLLPISLPSFPPSLLPCSLPSSPLLSPPLLNPTPTDEKPPTPAHNPPQVSILNTLYRPASVSFRLASTTWTVNDAWATDAESTRMKQSLRRGSYAALNVYFQTNLSSAPYAYSPASTLLGYCTLPAAVTYAAAAAGGGAGEKSVEYPAGDYATDGCNVLAGSMPKAPVPAYGYSLGKTAVHEVGHWFGLLHTFEDNTCATGDPGDYCDDTPQESQSTTGCPTGKDSCPGSPGLDPISNYMDYSTDACYSRFSPDQLARMKNMFNLFRLGY